MSSYPTPQNEDQASSVFNDPDHNPFGILKSRRLIVVIWISVSAFYALRVLYALLGIWQIIPSAQEDPITTPLLTIAIFTIALFWVKRQRGLNVRYLLGTNRPKFSVFYGIMLVLSLLLFSLGISSFIFYLLSLSYPGYVSQLLEASNNLLDNTQSAFPQLYQALMLFLLLIYAPVVEELVFRGFLLQRWGIKWGVRRGLIASSVLFGVLHINNPIGLTLFGLVMGLLYLRSQSLWVPIVCHSLNNLGAVGIDWLSKAAAGGQTSTVSDIQEVGWMSLVLVAVSLPLLGWFIWRSWPKRADTIPYLANMQKSL